MTELDLFQANRAALFGVAYRMLGSASDAEDVLQDAWLRFSAAPSRRHPIAEGIPHDDRHALVPGSPEVGAHRARRVRRPMAAGADGDRRPSRARSDRWRRPNRSRLAFMVLLETLSPEERAVFLLREVFDYEYAEIAAMLETTTGQLPAAVPSRESADR